MRSPFDSDAVKCICFCQETNHYFDCTRLEAQQNNHDVYFEYVYNDDMPFLKLGEKYYSGYDYPLFFVRSVKDIATLVADKAIDILVARFNVNGSMYNFRSFYKTHIEIALYQDWNYTIVGRFHDVP